MREKKAVYVNGYLGIAGLILLVGIGAVSLFFGMINAMFSLTVLGFIFWFIAIVLLSSVTIVSPNQAKVILFFGQYVGTIRESGFFLTVPFAQKINISLKVRNFNSSVLKVNDLDGNPIEISAVVVF